MFTISAGTGNFMSGSQRTKTGDTQKLAVGFAESYTCGPKLMCSCACSKGTFSWCQMKL